MQYKGDIIPVRIPSSSSVDNMVPGGKLTLTRGTWVVLGSTGFPTGTSTGARTVQIALGGDDTTSYYKRVRVRNANESWCALEVSDICRVEDEMVVAVKASTTNGGSSESSLRIQALRVGDYVPLTE